MGFVSIMSLRSLRHDTLTKKGEINLPLNVSLEFLFDKQSYASA